ncbi:MAG TPA: hypothetical protein VF157_05695 [Chloroflexota bacterium]
MNLELNQEESDLLGRVLNNYLGDLRMEIGKTENYDWRQSLHADEDRIKAVLARLGHPASGGA